MLHHLVNLLFHSAALVPSRIGSNWGGIVFTIFIFAATEVALWRWGVLTGRWSRNVLIGLGAVVVSWAGLFVVSIVLTIYDDHQNLTGAAVRFKRDSAEQTTKLNALTVPQFHTQFNLSSAPVGEHFRDTLLTVVVYIANTGAPSATDEFTVSIIRNKHTIQTEPMIATPSTLVLMNGAEIHLGMGDWLPNVTQQPIPFNGRIRGWRQYIVRDVPATAFMHRGVTVILHYHDVRNNFYEARLDSEESKTQPTNPRTLQPNEPYPPANQGH